MLHTFDFEAENVNDCELDVIIGALREVLPDFRVFYGSGDHVTFEWETGTERNENE